HAHGTTKSLENGFALVVGVFTAQIVNMHGGLGVVDKALEKFAYQFGIKGADFISHEIGIKVQPGPPREINDYAAKRFIERDISVPIAADAGLIANGLGKSLTQGNADILGRVVIVDM